MNQQYLFLILLAVAFVALIVLPGRQRKKMAAQAQQLQNSLTPGTPVMTTSGIHGTVSRLGEGTVDIDIAPGVTVTFERRAVLQVKQPTTPDPTATGGATGDVTGSTQAEYPELGDDTPGDGAGGTTR
jgi:preprotein translocase subunit YajC